MDQVRHVICVWTLDGKIFVKTSPEGSPIKINEIEGPRDHLNQCQLRRMDQVRHVKSST